MIDLILILFFIAFVAVAFFVNKLMVSRSLMADNSLLQSETTTKLINSIRQEEDDLREERLMGNKRYRVLKIILIEEVSYIRSLTLEEAQKKISQGQSERIVDDPNFKVVIRLNASLRTLTSSAVKVTVFPKRLFGAFLSIEEWVYFKS